MGLPSEFFTTQSMLTLGGAVGATVVVCNGLQSALNFNPRWLALLIAQAISFYGVSLQPTFAPSDAIVATLNGFLIYCTTVGASTLVAGGTRAADAMPRARGAGESAYPQKSRGQRRFSSPWF